MDKPAITLSEAVSWAGSRAELARRLGVTPQAVNQWGEIPDGRLWQLHAIWRSGRSATTALAPLRPIHMEKHQEMDSIGNRIRALRLACGITQSELGRRIGISAPAITQLERSLSRMPKGFVLAGLCRELSTNSAWLLNGQGDPSATVALDGDRHDLVMLYESLPSQGRDLLMAQARMLQGSFARKVD